MIGKNVSHYKILDELGRGGMGVVYKAEDTKLGRLVALKFLSSQLTGDATAKERFLREARAAAILRHDSICAIHEIGEEDDGTMYLVMPFYEGTTLKERISDGTLIADEAVSIARQIASGLSAAHAQGLTHRDIKPGNIMLTSGDRVKVLDFGLAKLAGDVDLTLTSSTVGTMAYMSPEQIQNGAVDARSDLWSLGVVLYEMLTGEKPFSGNYDAAIVYGIVNQPLELEHPQIPEWLRPVLAKLLDKSPGNRYASAEELLGALGGDISIDSGSIQRTLSKSEHPSTRKWLAIGLATMATAAVVALVLWLSLRGGSGSAVPAQAVSSVSGLPTVGVMYIENNTSRERLGFVLRDMLARNLGQEDSIQVISNQRLKDILNQETGGETESVSASTATIVANRAGVQTMILGSVVQFGSEFVLEAEITDVKTGSIIDAVSATASSESEFIAAVNQLTEGILRGSGTVWAGESGLYRIENVATASLSAYELFEKGEDEASHWRFDDAVQSFEAALSIDSTFVAPYIGAFRASSAISFRPTKSIEYQNSLLERAARQQIHATEKEIEILALFRKTLTFSNSAKQAAESKRLADSYPDDKLLQYFAARSLSGNIKYDYFNRLFELDPSNAIGYNELAYTLIWDNRLDEAVSTIRRYRTLQPDVINSTDSAWEVMTAAGRTDDALALLDRALSEHPDWSSVLWRKAYSQILAGDSSGASGDIEAWASTTSAPARMEAWTKSHVALALGQWGRARILSSAYLRESRRVRSDAELLFDLRNHAAVLHANLLHDQAEQILSEAVEISRQVYGPEFNPYPVLEAYQNGLGYADAGNISELEKWIGRLRTALTASGIDGRHVLYLRLLEMHASILKGEMADAATILDGLGEIKLWGTSHYYRMAARVYAWQGDLEKALFALQLVKNAVGMRVFEVSAFGSFFADHAIAGFEVARVYETVGDKAEAIKHYEEAIRSWEGAHADLPYLKRARERLVALKSGV